jgi:hypothetical protein
MVYHLFYVSSDVLAVADIEVVGGPGRCRHGLRYILSGMPVSTIAFSSSIFFPALLYSRLLLPPHRSEEEK